MNSLAAKKSSKAYARFRSRLKGVESSMGENALKNSVDIYKDYFGSKLRLKGASLTMDEVERRLKGSGVSEETMSIVARVHQRYMRLEYSSGSEGTDKSWYNDLSRIVKEAEQCISS